MAEENLKPKSKNKRKKTQADDEDKSCKEDNVVVPEKKKKKLNKEANTGEVEEISHSKKVKRKTHNKPEKDEEEFQNVPDKTTEISEDKDTELTRKKKKKKSKDSVSNSLGTIDNELVKTAEKNLQVNGLDVATTSTSENTTGNEGLSNEKKTKRKKKNKSKDTQSCAKKNSDLYSKSHIEQAVKYLHTWNSDKGSWKFNKVHQLRLIHMMYDTSIVNNDDFQTLLLYLAGMKGKAKEITHNQAMKFVDGEMENGVAVSVTKEQRAREVVQVLS